jgi:predicted ArsR family transcriptional regulator
MSYALPVQSTRARIIELLRQRHEATVEDLMQELALAPATVRRHLDVLQRDGLVGMRAVRRATGRPHFVFSLTAAGQDHLEAHHIRVTSRVVEELIALRPADTRGRSGREVASLVFERLAQRLAASCVPRVTARGLGERLQQALGALAEEGLAFEVTQQHDGYLLEGRGCPCRRIVDAPGEACSHDQRLLSSLLEAEVEPANVDAATGGCAYLVRTEGL